MPNLMKMAAIAHWRAISRVGGEDVKYYATASNVVDLVAVPGATTTANVYADGHVASEKSVDFTILGSSIDFTPELGDRLLWDGRWYEVLSPGGQRHFEFSDHYEQIIRIHTKHVAEDISVLSSWIWQDGDAHLNQQAEQMEFKAEL